MNSIQHIKKAEIHVHLEATISPELCRKFAKRNNVSISEDISGEQKNQLTINTNWTNNRLILGAGIYFNSYKRKTQLYTCFFSYFLLY